MPHVPQCPATAHMGSSGCCAPLQPAASHSMKRNDGGTTQNTECRQFYILGCCCCCCCRSGKPQMSIAQSGVELLSISQMSHKPPLEPGQFPGPLPTRSRLLPTSQPGLGRGAAAAHPFFTAFPNSSQICFRQSSLLQLFLPTRPFLKAQALNLLGSGILPSCFQHPCSSGKERFRV